MAEDQLEGLGTRDQRSGIQKLFLLSLSALCRTVLSYQLVVFPFVYFLYYYYWKCNFAFL